MSSESKNDKTRFVHVSTGHKQIGDSAPVNPPIMRASTVLYRNTTAAADIRRRSDAGEPVLRYGSRGTSTVFAFEEAMAEVERGRKAFLSPTGLSAIAHVFLTFPKPGDHVLVSESVYGPARALAVDYLAHRGITVEFYPGGHEEVAKRLKPNTKLIHIDNPGSIIYDIQDLPALRKVAGDKVVISVDNTWGTAGLYRPLTLGADVSAIAVTKYIGGHSDLMMGAVVANERVWKELNQTQALLGFTVSPDDAYTALRGLRTVAARLPVHQRHAMEVIRWLETQLSVERILYPALPTDPGHALWKRDFAGANGLFTVVFKKHVSPQMANAFIDALKMHGMGASWGGYESLALTYPAGVRGWSGGTVVRLHAGLEDPADIIADLKLGFAAIGG